MSARNPYNHINGLGPTTYRRWCKSPDGASGHIEAGKGKVPSKSPSNCFARAIPAKRRENRERNSLSFSVDYAQRYRHSKVQTCNPHSHSIVSGRPKALKKLNLRMCQFAHTVGNTVRTKRYRKRKDKCSVHQRRNLSSFIVNSHSTPGLRRKQPALLPQPPEDHIGGRV